MYEKELGQAIACRRKMGVLVFGRNGNLEFSSMEAIRQLAESGVALSAGSFASDNEDVKSRIDAAVNACLSKKERDETWVMLGESPVSSILMSIYYTDKTRDGEGVVVGLIRSPGFTLWDDDGPRIMEAFGLTRREAQLGLHLSRGQDLREFASGHFLTINTVKTHLKQLFKKMGVNRQIQVAVVVWAALR